MFVVVDRGKSGRHTRGWSPPRRTRGGSPRCRASRPPRGYAVRGWGDVLGVDEDGEALGGAAMRDWSGYPGERHALVVHGARRMLAHDDRSGVLRIAAAWRPSPPVSRARCLVAAGPSWTMRTPLWCVPAENIGSTACIFLRQPAHPANPGVRWQAGLPDYAVPPPIEARMIRSASSGEKPLRRLKASQASRASRPLAISSSVGQ